MIIDDKYKDRVSNHLAKKITQDALEGKGYFARGVIESIRLLEGMRIAPSSEAMRHTEREFKGSLAGFHHIHVSEDTITRAYNALRQKGEHPEKAPSSQDLLQRARSITIEKFLSSKGINATGDSFEQMVEKMLSIAEKIGVDKCQAELSVIITELAYKPFEGSNEISGDWLIYWKRNDGVRFYLDSFEHIPSDDIDLQQSTAEHLKNILNSMDTTI
ncbi:hypothetical protein G3D72_001218 [Escherichia coli]|uniref:hypothetical protein n=1 Tax=Escherichia coli TaxID=562 RepID=UPI0016B6EBB6|nr:hypothetical protein [Escherichia coli]EFC6797874.1 hypothetical protein [Escherichia coli]EFJ4021648.1 hypothetical protein [Escherichia coli]MCV4303735.1 hypothetical protein [Escherichia coli]MED0300826.1 hypothetical protein [Escherichia coli]HAL6822688.1 hypothetical protein [Escherichia coli]